MQKLCLALALLLASNSYGWNALGHRLIAQIAYDHLTSRAKQIYNQYNRAVETIDHNKYRAQNLVNSAAWLDSLRRPDELWLLDKHYIDLPFSDDGSKLFPPKKVNAVSAIADAAAVLQSKSANDIAKGFNLRILLHVVGDIHQPLHAVSRYSAAFPQGDKGGNLVSLGKNPIATNLHVYWDKGGGYLSKKRSHSRSQLRKKASYIEQLWPCQLDKMVLDPKQWAEESHQIAINQAYQLRAGQKPDKKYQYKVKRLTEQRIALAGCRLAALLNKLA